MVAPAFGFSAGDFVAAVQALNTVRKAFKDAGGSVEQYNDTISKIDRLKVILQRLQGLYGSNQDGNTNDTLELVIRPAALACGTRLNAFLHDIGAYQQQFGSKKTIFGLKTGLAKGKWALSTAKKVDALWSSLQPELLTISLALTLDLSPHRASEDTKLLLLDFQRHIDNEGTQLRNIEARLADLKQDYRLDQLGENLLNIRQILANNHIDIKSFIAASNQVIAPVTAHNVHSQPSTRDLDICRPSIKSLSQELAAAIWVYLLKQFILVIAVFRRIPASPQRLLCNSIYVEDALGRNLVLPYGTFRSWRLFIAKLNDAFEGCPGEHQVAKSRFQLTLRGQSQRIIHGREDWEQMVVPGANVQMAIMLDQLLCTTGRCPRPSCGASNSTASAGSWVKCIRCDLQYIVAQPRFNASVIPSRTSEPQKVVQNTTTNNKANYTTQAGHESHMQNRMEEMIHWDHSTLMSPTQQRMDSKDFQPRKVSGTITKRGITPKSRYRSRPVKNSQAISHASEAISPPNTMNIKHFDRNQDERDIIRLKTVVVSMSLTHYSFRPTEDQKFYKHSLVRENVDQHPTTQGTRWFHGREQPADFFSQLIFMETTKSEPEFESLQESEIEKLSSTTAYTGLYTCTYQNCTQRFASPALLQRHKREAHRTTHILGAISLPEQNLKFDLGIRQQPDLACVECNFAKDIRSSIVRQLPIVELSLIDSEGNRVGTDNLLYFCRCTLRRVRSVLDEPLHPRIALRYRKVEETFESWISYARRLQDPDGSLRDFFIFENIELPSEGEYNLEFSLVPTHTVKIVFPISVISDPFIAIRESSWFKLLAVTDGQKYREDEEKDDQRFESFDESSRPSGLSHPLLTRYLSNLRTSRRIPPRNLLRTYLTGDQLNL